MSSRSTGNLVMAAIVSLVAIYLIWDVAVKPKTLQWDFRSYYIAAQYQAEGNDPYDITAARHVVGAVVHPFVYPPVTLYIFRLLAVFEYNTAYLIWLAFKLLLALLLLLIWREAFVEERAGWPFYLFVLLGFAGTFYTDLKAGNIALLEQVLIWAGLLFLVKNRLAAFCACIVAASLFKGLPIAFLLLLLVFKVPRRWEYLGGSILAYLAINVLDYVLHPGLYLKYLSLALSVDERGQAFNPSTLAFVRDLADAVREVGVPLVATQILAVAVYLATVMGAVYLTYRYFWKSWQEHAGGESALSGHLIPAIYMATMVFGVIMPRFKIYSFILLLPAAWYVIRRLRFSSNTGIVAFLVLFILLSITNRTPLPLESRTIEGFFNYLPLFTAWLIWGLMLWLAQKRLTSPVSKTS